MSTTGQKIQDLVKANRLEEAIDLLIDAAKTQGGQEAHNSAILIAARYKEYEEHKLNNTLAENVLGTEAASIRDTILELTEHLSVAANEARANDAADASRLDRLYNVLIKSLLLLLLIISVGVLIMGVMFPQIAKGGDVEDGRIFLFGVSTTGIASSAFFYPRIAKKTA